jgi:hypothetical protein
MKEEPVDPRMEKLVASLYKELPADEERELKELIERDPGLRAEWEELKSMRSMLGAFEVEETVPSFVVVDPEPARKLKLGGFWGDVREKLGGFFAVSGWAVAAAAIVVMVLAIKGYRLEPVEGGFAVVKGSKAAPVETQEQNLAGSEKPVAPKTDPVPAPVEEPSTPVRPAPETNKPAPPVQLVSDERYVTRDQLESESAAMIRMFAEIMNDYRSRRDAETAALLQTVYGSLNDRQLSDYQDLRGRIDAVGLGLMAEQSRTNERLDLMQQTVVDSLLLESKSPDQNGGEKK